MIINTCELTVPTWTFHEHVNTGTSAAFLFSFTDAPVMRALDLYREEEMTT
jgi:gentisate 1,2-dioxygenase